MDEFAQRFVRNEVARHQQQAIRLLRDVEQDVAAVVRRLEGVDPGQIAGVRRVASVGSLRNAVAALVEAEARIARLDSIADVSGLFASAETEGKR